MSEYLTTNDIAREWHVSHSWVEKARKRESDPLPMKLLPGKKYGYLIHRDALREWFDRNT